MMKTRIDSCLLMVGLILLSMRAMAQSSVIYELPFNSRDNNNNFSVIGSSSIAIPVKGGVYDAALKGWLIPPAAKLGIVNFDYCLADTSLILASRERDSLIVVKGSSEGEGGYLKTRFFSLPMGACVIQVVGLDSFYAWHVDREYSSIYFYSRSSGLRTIVQLRDTISSFQSVGQSAILFSIKNEIFAVTANSQPMTIASFQTAVDGLAIVDSGLMFVSTKAGIFRIKGMGGAELVTRNTHGYLRVSAGRLFVLDSEKNKIVQLTL